jgi:superfamily II DNA or RNA helicase
MRRVVHQSAVRVDAMVHIPKRLIDTEKLKRAHRFAVYDLEGEPTWITLYQESRAFLSLPRKVGMELVNRLGWEIEDRRSGGFEFLDAIPEIKLKDNQVNFVPEMVEVADACGDAIIQGRTGFGKTVCSLEMARRLGRTVLVIVDQDNILEQWKKRITQFWGLPEDRIGIAQGSRCDYEDKSIVIGMLQTLYQRDYPQEFYDYFGTVIIDEVHVASAPQFAGVCKKFTAYYRIGVTATPRLDQYRRIIESHLGVPELVAAGQHGKSMVYYAEHEGVVSWYANISPKAGRYLTELSEDTERNWLLATILQRLYQAGREILAVSDRIEQLENLFAMCALSGVPAEAMEIITGFYTTWAYAKDDRPKRKPAYLEPRAPYTPVKLQRVRKRLNKKKKQQALERKVSIRFATYQIFGKATDVPDLDAGVDCTPRAKVEQVHGRILRELEGKQVPVWVTIRDTLSYKAEYQFIKRLTDYVSSNADIYAMDVGLNKSRKITDISALQREIRERVEWLKEQRIEKTPEGLNTLVTPSTAAAYRPVAAAPTGRTSRSRRTR